jgi:serine/threonine-protein kinase
MLERVGNCRIEAELAAGGMAVIYRAEQEVLGRKVAIKALKSAVMQEAGFVQRFEREARTLAQLQHENLVHVYDFYREHGALFIVMELVDGVDLYDLLDRAGALPPEVAAIIALNVARALDYLHYSGVLHRDLKPANILLTKSGGVKLGDFGIADDRLYAAGPGAQWHVGLRDKADLTATGVGLGTPSYMSPEQILGERLDFRSDQFALGVVLYQMLGGRKPFVEDTEQSVLEKIRSQPTPPLPKAVRGRRVPPELARIALRCLQKDRRHRFATPQDLVLALERFLSQRLDVNYHARLVLYLREQGFVSPAEAELVLRPLAGSLPTTGAAARQRAGQAVTRRVALLLLAIVGAMAAALAGLHLFHVGAPLPALVRDGESAPGAGQLLVFADPWAEVYVDGQWAETTPFARPLRLRPGRHLVELRNPHYQPVRQLMDIEPTPAPGAGPGTGSGPGKPQELRVTLHELVPGRPGSAVSP